MQPSSIYLFFKKVLFVLRLKNTGHIAEKNCINKKEIKRRMRLIPSRYKFVNISNELAMAIAIPIQYLPIPYP